MIAYGPTRPAYVGLVEVLVEDDNGRYFVVYVEAVDKAEARKRVEYILAPYSARVIRPRNTEL